MVLVCVFAFRAFSEGTRLAVAGYPEDLRRMTVTHRSRHRRCLLPLKFSPTLPVRMQLPGCNPILQQQQQEWSAPTRVTVFQRNIQKARCWLRQET